MAKTSKTWHGIPREEIPWFPTVDNDTCIGCTLCYVSCGRAVYEMQDNKAVVENPYNCMVGCSTCATVCPVEAITFPGRELIWNVEREHKIFKIVRQEAKEKMVKAEISNVRSEAQAYIAQLITHARMEVAGQFGEKRFLIKLKDLVDERPYDIVNLQLDVPTVQGLKENTPAILSFEVTSTQQEDIQEFLSEIRTLVKENDLILISENNL
ncbi:MAG: ferredoxin family protein [Anaerolineales bacterium]|nr:ferredoxin family protein [Anaerolineales bacterium]